MKKSEAIADMVEIARYHDGGYLEPYVALRLLEHLEERGMTPPPIKMVAQGHGCLCTMRQGNDKCVECDDRNNYYENRWEKE